jgi:hypothetical protein
MILRCRSSDNYTANQDFVPPPSYQGQPDDFRAAGKIKLSSCQIGAILAFLDTPTDAFADQHPSYQCGICKAGVSAEWRYFAGNGAALFTTLAGFLNQQR